MLWLLHSKVKPTNVILFTHQPHFKVETQYKYMFVLLQIAVNGEDEDERNWKPTPCHEICGFFSQVLSNSSHSSLLLGYGEKQTVQWWLWEGGVQQPFRVQVRRIFNIKPLFLFLSMSFIMLCLFQVLSLHKWNLSCICICLLCIIILQMLHQRLDSLSLWPG